MAKQPPIALIILDGFGYSKESEYNAIFHAKKPHLNTWFTHYPHALLAASGKAVGLSDYYAPNSATGHVTIGSGRIIQQPATLIHEAIADKSFFKNPTLIQQLEKLRQKRAALHIMGLLSDTGIHSDIETLYACLDAAHQHGIRYVFIHAFLDGQDTAPRSAQRYLSQLDAALTALEYGSLGSLHGRFYAMDKSNHWQRTAASYTILTSKEQMPPMLWEGVLEHYYAEGLNDDRIPPTRLDPTSCIDQEDGIIFLNFRADSARQLTAAFVDPHFNHFKTKQLHLSCFITPTLYADTLPTNVLFPPTPIPHTLKEVLSNAGKTITSIAETEKYAHITYFFDGGKEITVPGETRILVPSLMVDDYKDYPCMSAAEITQKAISSLRTHPTDFYLINYANADMVGHAGDFKATIQAIECLDAELAKLYDVLVAQMNGIMIITSDHGKAEQMFDPAAQQPKTGHTHNPVPLLVVGNAFNDMHTLQMQQLADIAPFILKIMNIAVPDEMKR